MRKCAIGAITKVIVRQKRYDKGLNNCQAGKCTAPKPSFRSSCSNLEGISGNFGGIEGSVSQSALDSGCTSQYPCFKESLCTGRGFRSSRIRLTVSRDKRVIKVLRELLLQNGLFQSHCLFFAREEKGKRNRYCSSGTKIASDRYVIFRSFSKFPSYAPSRKVFNLPCLYPHAVKTKEPKIGINKKKLKRIEG